MFNRLEIQHAGPIDTMALPAGQYVANGLIGSLNARLAVRAASDGAWSIAIDNDKDDRIDLVISTSADEERALQPAQ